MPANLIGRDFGLRVFARASRILPREVRVHAVDRLELPVIADVIVMGMRIEHDDRQPRKLCRNFPDVTNSHAGVEEHGPVVPDDQVANGLFRLMRFVNSENRGCEPVDLEPRIADRYALEAFVVSPWKRAAPLGNLRLSI